MGCDGCNHRFSSAVVVASPSDDLVRSDKRKVGPVKVARFRAREIEYLELQPAAPGRFYQP